jgi:hypothetical protein
MADVVESELKNAAVDSKGMNTSNRRQFGNGVLKDRRSPFNSS